MESKDQIPLPDPLFYLVKKFEKKPDDETKQKVIGIVRELINNNFTSLVDVLYRVDIDEKKLKEILKSHPDVDSASIIADLIISRQLEKAAMRNQFANKRRPTGHDSW